MVKRFFASSESPDLRPVPVDSLVRLRDDGTWEIPIHIENNSTAIGEHVVVNVEVLNPSACESISATGWNFGDVSALNPGQRMFGVYLQGVVHRGVNTVIGSLLVKMKVHRRPKRTLRLRINIFANKMRARATELTLNLAKAGFAVKKTEERFLY